MGDSFASDTVLSRNKGFLYFWSEMLLTMLLGTLLHQTDLVVAHVQLLVPQWKISPHWKESSGPSNKFGPDGVSRSVHPGVSQGKRQDKSSHVRLLVTTFDLGRNFGRKLDFSQETRCPWLTSHVWLSATLVSFRSWSYAGFQQIQR